VWRVLAGLTPAGAPYSYALSKHGARASHLPCVTRQRISATRPGHSRGSDRGLAQGRVPRRGCAIGRRGHRSGRPLEQGPQQFVPNLRAPSITPSWRVMTSSAPSLIILLARGLVASTKVSITARSSARVPASRHEPHWVGSTRESRREGTRPPPALWWPSRTDAPSRSRITTGTTA